MACRDKCEYWTVHIMRKTTAWTYDGDNKTAAQAKGISKDKYDAIKASLEKYEEELRESKEWVTDQCPANCPCDSFVVWRSSPSSDDIIRKSGKMSAKRTFTFKDYLWSGYCLSGKLKKGPKVKEVAFRPRKGKQAKA